MRISQLSKPEEGEAHTDSVWSCVWTPAGNQLITASVDETVSVYSDDQGKLSRYHAYPGHTLGAISVAVDPTGEFAASSALDSYIRWGTRSGSTSRSLQSSARTTSRWTALGADCHALACRVWSIQNHETAQVCLGCCSAVVGEALA